MIDYYYWTTSNCHKITIFLEEAGLEYRLLPVNIGQGEQFAPEFLKVFPNNKVPAIIDRAPADGGEPLALFESGAILQYLAEKTGKFLPTGMRARAETLQWLTWQVAGLGPMAGQNGYFNVYAAEKVPHAMARYRNETNRLYGVLDERLAGRDFITGSFSVADIACYPWIVPHKLHGQDLEDFPNIRRWFQAIRERPAVQRAYARIDEINPVMQPGVPFRQTEATRAILYGQTARSRAIRDA